MFFVLVAGAVAVIDPAIAAHAGAATGPGARMVSVARPMQFIVTARAAESSEPNTTAPAPASTSTTSTTRPTPTTTASVTTAPRPVAVAHAAHVAPAPAPLVLPAPTSCAG